MDEQALNDLIADETGTAKTDLGGLAKSESGKSKKNPQGRGRRGGKNRGNAAVLADADEIVISGKERYTGRIPIGAISEQPTTLLYEVIDDWQGWRIEVDGYWCKIEYLEYFEETGLCGIKAGGRINSYDKDTTPVLR